MIELKVTKWASWWTRPSFSPIQVQCWLNQLSKWLLRVHVNYIILKVSLDKDTSLDIGGFCWPDVSFWLKTLMGSNQINPAFQSLPSHSRMLLLYELGQ